MESRTLHELKDLLNRDNNVTIVDDNIRQLYPDLLEGLTRIPIQAEESNKNLCTVEGIYQRFHELSITRQHSIYAIGGGITTDMAGFAAATWKRGCNLVLVPTTLLAMVDAAIGGKNGVNFQGMKNAVGSFNEPQEILIVTEFLETLDPVQVQCGIAEIVKIALIDENPLYELLMSGANPTNKAIIRLAINRKLHYCRVDPYDLGERWKLNLGHTFGHLIESASDYTIPHGMAVAMGIRYAARFSREMGWITDKDEQNIHTILDWFDLPIKPDERTLDRIRSNAVEILRSDKKRGTAHMQLVCFDGFRSTFVYECVEVEQLVSMFSIDRACR